MTLHAGTVEMVVDAFLDNEDNDDIINPIHSTGFARRHGFRGPLVGGVTVWGWAVPAILEAAGEGWLDRGWSGFRFRHPTYSRRPHDDPRPAHTLVGRTACLPSR